MLQLRFEPFRSGATSLTSKRTQLFFKTSSPPSALQVLAVANNERDAQWTLHPMTIHLICTGNIYRSRLAEAYCASRAVPGLRVFSSGIATALNGGAAITPYAAHVLSEFGLERFAASFWQQTTAALVRVSDVLVFVEREHYCFCERWIDPIRHKIEIWDIPDIGQMDPAGIMNKVAHAFEPIQRRTDILLTALKPQE